MAAALVSAWPAAQALRPSRRMADVLGAVDLAAQVPASFGLWRTDTTLRPLLPDPALQSALGSTYSQVLARSYVHAEGTRVMLSMAYGNDQASDATAVHRPEFCYRSQGFEVQDLGDHDIRLGALPPPLTLPIPLRVRRLASQLGTRHEPISYWITLGNTATLPGLGRKWQQLRLGLAGWVADGMVVRISTLGPAGAPAFAWHQAFATDLHAAMPAAVQARYFGGGHAE